MLNRIRELATLGRVALWMVALPALKHLLPLPRLVRLMWVARGSRPRNRDSERAVLAAVGRLYGHGVIPRRHNCLERGLVTYRMLSALNANPILVVGLGSTNAVSSGHAWVMVDGGAVLEDEHALRHLSPVLAFGPRGVLLDDAPDRPATAHGSA